MRILIIYILFLLHLDLSAQDTLRHSLEFRQRYENFTTSDKQRIFSSLQYGYKIAGKHDIYGRVIYQNINGEGALQSMVDFYPTYNKGYMFFSFRYSNSQLFPKVTLMGEIYTKVMQKHEASIGLRYLRPLDQYDIYIITGTYGIYHGNWFTYIRPMVSFLEDGISWSGMLVTRRYFGIGKTYLEAMLLKGDDTGTSRPVGSIENSFGSDTYFIRLKGHLRLPKNFEIEIGSDYSGIFIPKANGSTSEVNIWGIDVALKKTFN
jgi:YaiO family outer membrane protein